MRFITLSATALVLLAAPALAEEKCNVPQAEWRSEAELTADLTAKGWTISNIKTEDGCYEVYGKDEKGTRVEVFLNPKTFELVGSDE